MFGWGIALAEWWLLAEKFISFPEEKKSKQLCTDQLAQAAGSMVGNLQGCAVDKAVSSLPVSHIIADRSLSDKEE